MIEKALLVASGGAIGAVARMFVGGWVARLTGATYLGTLSVNVVGSLAMGVLAVVLMEKLVGDWERLSPFLMTGLLGGFTTFSAFSLDVLYLIERGRNAAALGYVSASVLLSVLGLYMGLTLARVWMQ